MASNSPASAPPARPARRVASRAWRGLKRLVLFSLLGAIVLSALYLWLAASYSYSRGERAGYVQKFSKKGWICKTWEGELAMANLPGSMPERFVFSLRDDKVAAEINARVGQRVTLSYEEHIPLPSCFGDTSYWVTSVRPIAAP